MRRISRIFLLSVFAVVFAFTAALYQSQTGVRFTVPSILDDLSRGEEYRSEISAAQFRSADKVLVMLSDISKRMESMEAGDYSRGGGATPQVSELLPDPDVLWNPFVVARRVEERGIYLMEVAEGEKALQNLELVGFGLSPVPSASFIVRMSGGASAEYSTVGIGDVLQGWVVSSISESQVAFQKGRLTKTFDVRAALDPIRYTVRQQYEWQRKILREGEPEQQPQQPGVMSQIAVPQQKLPFYMGMPPMPNQGTDAERTIPGGSGQKLPVAPGIGAES